MEYKIMNSKFEKLCDIVRFSPLKLVKPESDADHIVIMSSMALKLVLRINALLTNEDKCDLCIDIRDVMYRIFIHDLEETMGTDLSRTFKYDESGEFHRALDNRYKDLFLGYSEKSFGTDGAKKLFDEMQSSKCIDTVEGLVVKLLDFIQAGNKICTEIMSHNIDIVPELINIEREIPALRTYITDDYDVIIRTSLSEAIDELSDKVSCVRNYLNNSEWGKSVYNSFSDKDNLN